MPVLVSELPPLLDYPNHLARMLVLRDAGSDPAIGAMYAVDWRPIPNIGLDLLLPTLARFVPLLVAGRIAVVAAVWLPVLGVAALHRAVFGQASLWPLASAVVATGGVLFAGFLNFQIGVGLALLAAAYWQKREGIAGLCAFSFAVFLCHLLAWLFLGLLILSLRRGRWFAPVPAFAGPLLLLASHASPTPAGDFGGMFAGYWAAMGDFSLHKKALTALFAVSSYGWPLDLLCLLLGALILAVCWRAGRLCIAWRLVPALAVLAVAYPLAPSTFLGTGFLDFRIPPLFLLLAIAATNPAPRGMALPGLLGAAMLARLGWIGIVWAGHAADIADMRHAIAPVPPRASVAVVTAANEAEAGPEPRARKILARFDASFHMPALLVIERHAFWPLLFSAPGKQPVSVRPPYSAIAMHEGWPVSWRELAAPTPAGAQEAPYLAHWRRDFDYVLLLYASRLPAGDDPPAPGLALAARGEFASLYRIER